MADNLLKFVITEKSRLVKFAEGVDPNTGAPFEVKEGATITYTGQDAVDHLKQLGYTDEQILKMEEMSANATN